MSDPHDAMRPPLRLDDVPGWFPVLDQVLFDWVLDRQEAAGVRGDLLEVGVYVTPPARKRGGFSLSGLSFATDQPGL
ncbi:hypothetical protein [Streptomyces sp. bgisy153]|uniref:hypothetical protein n=1 Tax=Streptomyces sp. bgisy153 TaxID=3413793 RepID=UPI003D7294F2